MRLDIPDCLTLWSIFLEMWSRSCLFLQAHLEAAGKGLCWAAAGGQVWQQHDDGSRYSKSLCGRRNAEETWSFLVWVAYDFGSSDLSGPSGERISAVALCGSDGVWSQECWCPKGWDWISFEPRSLEICCSSQLSLGLGSPGKLGLCSFCVSTIPSFFRTTQVGMIFADQAWCSGDFQRHQETPDRPLPAGRPLFVLKAWAELQKWQVFINSSAPSSVPSCPGLPWERPQRAASGSLCNGFRDEHRILQRPCSSKA